MTLKPSFAHLCAAFAIAVSTLLPAVAQTPEPPDTDDYIPLSETVLMACSKDGYMHYYGGPIYISKTDLDRQSMMRGDFDLARHETNLQKTFVNAVARYNASELLSADPIIAIDRALRTTAREEEARSGISSGFLALLIDLSPAPDAENCYKGSAYQGPTPE